MSNPFASSLELLRQNAPAEHARLAEERKRIQAMPKPLSLTPAEERAEIIRHNAAMSAQSIAKVDSQVAANMDRRAVEQIEREQELARLASLIGDRIAERVVTAIKAALQDGGRDSLSREQRN